MQTTNPRNLIKHPQNHAIYGYEDINELKDSIAQHGMLEPIVVSQNHVVVSGHRRLQAALELGLLEVPIRIETFVDDHAILEALLLANLYREKTKLQRHAEIDMWAVIEAEKARRRMLATQNNEAGRAASKPGLQAGEQGRANDLAASRLGISGQSYFQGKQVRAVISQSPKPVAEALATVFEQSVKVASELAKTAPEKAIEVAKLITEQEMSADAAFKEVKRAEQKAERVERKVEAARVLPTGVYSVIYADPPWQYNNSGFDASAEAHYSTMPTSAICDMLTNLDIQVADNAVLFMWVTNPLLADGLRVMQAWGFHYKTNMVWVKDRATSIGFYARGKHELLFIGTRGSMTPLHSTGLPDSVLEYPRTSHSRKPDLYDLIEGLYPNQHYLELFARWQPPRQDWFFWGDQHETTD